jgi:threonylcarbamoyladenosine tRNA methylthiotransferase MtaB
VPGLRRLRLSSLDPAVMDEPLFELLGEEARLMPHLHLSIQAGDDMVLKRMKRRHDRAGVIRFCECARAARPDVAFGADLIAGFPTETEEMFSGTLALVEDCGLTFLHVFPYSPRPGTPAARMPRVHSKTAKSRATRLRAAGDAARDAFFTAHAGCAVEILVEANGRGYTPHYAPVRLSAKYGAPAAGEIVRARVTGHDGKTLFAEPIS